MSNAYSTTFILSFKGFCRECPFSEAVRVAQGPRWNYPEPTLIKSENAWKKGKNGDENELIIANVKSILNKLSKDNFDKLSTRLFNIELDSVELVQGVILTIFDKAINEPHFGEVYAEMCLKLESKTYCNGSINFKREILTQCQTEFEKEIKIMRRSLGNIKFIGELFKQKLINNNVITKCINTLLSNINANDNKNENIECLCKLITTVGKISDNNNRIKMDKYFEILTVISNDQSNDFRHRFMIKDVIDLRKNNWVSRRKENRVMTKKEVRAETNNENHPFKTRRNKIL
jgi:translation initiation factor 4G